MREMVLNDLGEIVKKQWLWLADNFKYIKLDEWVIMPNHFHGIMEIINEHYYKQSGLIFGERHSVGNGRDRSLRTPDKPKIKPLPEIIGAFKTTSSKLIHLNQNNFLFQWQKSFHDRVIRDENEFLNIRYYICGQVMGITR